MRIQSYSEESLALALSNEHTPASVVTSKNHFTYLKEYLGTSGLCAKTIIVEERYVSKDFLRDFASYYAFCFEDYSKFCNRVHFFPNEFDEETFYSAILAPEKNLKNFWSNYLGFIVVKPIPTKIIGYTIHVFGKEVKIKSLAFQEQDSVLAACATTAIWSMLNKASVGFNTIKLTAENLGMKPGKQKMTKEQVKSLLKSNSNLIDEEEDLSEYIDSLDWNSGLSEDELRKGYDTFKDEKYNKEIVIIANKYGLQITDLKTFVKKIMSRMIFGGEELTDLLEPLDLSWKERRTKELALMEDLVPQLKKLAGEREISGLAAYDNK